MNLLATRSRAADRNASLALQSAAERQLASVQAMQLSIDRQRLSVRHQAQGSIEKETSAEAFFTIPWPKTLSVEPLAAECSPLPADVVESLVAENSKSENVKPELLREVMRRESGFRPCALSRAGAQGLMQLMPATAAQFHVSDVFNPKQNVAAGTKFLKALLDRYQGNVALALGAYNAGPGRVDEAGGVPAIPETQDYVAKILSAVMY